MSECEGVGAGEGLEEERVLSNERRKNQYAIR
jgi:hypothetical protein